MKTSALKYTILSWVSGFSMAILLLVPFHALLTVWGSTIIGHYTALRLWKEVLLLLSAAGVLYLVLTDHKIRFHTMSRRLVWLILGYILLNFIWCLLAYSDHEVTPKAIGYGLIINTRFLIFFLITWSVALRLGRLRNNWTRLVFWPAAAVVGFGLLQVTVLPHDFLRHLGYGASTIEPFETINHNINYVRIASTLRGANPLGAYLLVPISLLSVLIISGKRNWKTIGLLVTSLAVLFFSFSRSAWVGAIVSLLIVMALSLKTAKSRRLAAVVVAAVGLLAASTALILHDNTRYENFVFHTQDNSAIPVSSNQGHAAALKQGVKDLSHEPLGTAPGSAGPASVYNDGKTKISENYFLQIGQETGWLGLTMFVLINAGVGYLLWLRRDDPLALGLFASLIGLTLVNLLSHAWTDDTLAYVWWGLAGIAVAPTKIKE